MLITNSFVVLNLPKTGSSFVRNIIKSLYETNEYGLIGKIYRMFGIDRSKYIELNMPHPLISNYRDQHGALFQIPEKHRQKPVVSVVRNPYSRLLSQYAYRWWVNYPELDMKLLKKNLPNFPKLNLKEYLEYRKLKSNELKEKFGINQDIKIGDQSIQFIYMFAASPFDIFASLEKGKIKAAAISELLGNIHFLKQEHLSDELIKFLIDIGFKDAEVNFIRSQDRINVSAKDHKTNQKEKNILENYLEEYEYLIYGILKEQGISYTWKNNGKND